MLWIGDVRVLWFRVLGPGSSDRQVLEAVDIGIPHIGPSGNRREINLSLTGTPQPSVEERSRQCCGLNPTAQTNLDPARP